MVIMERQSGLWEMKCPKCESEQIVKNGKVTLKDKSSIQKYRCRACTQRFNERTGTAMARLRTPLMLVSLAINIRTEGMGVRATGRALEKSHSTISRWEQRLAAQANKWSPAAPVGAEVTIEGDEVYTRVGENLSPHSK
jgi:transposase-like protein